jgi:cytidylate kinase
MAIIIISRGSYTWGREVAEKVAQQLDYDCISREGLLESSKKFNIPEINLHRALEETSSIFERFMRERKEEYLFFLKMAILKNVHQNNVVGHGYSGHLLIKDIPHVLSVRINVALEDRIKLAMEREGMSEGEAFRFINKLDDQRRKWGRKIFGVDIWDSSLYDLVLQINKITTDDAVDIICRTVGMKNFQTTPQSQKIMDDMVLAADVKFALFETRPDVEVLANDGSVLVKAQEDGSDDEELVDSIKGIVTGMAGVKEVNVDIIAGT